MTMEFSAAPARLKATPSWLISQTASVTQRLVTDGLTRIGAHRSHYSVLAVLEEFGPASQAALGRRTGIDRSDMVALINELADRGLVERTPDPTDRRRNVIAITKPGLQHLANLDKAISRIQDELLAPLSPAQRTQLVALLTKVLASRTGS
jgi:DNA-binding MarR family transcriptional regulator